MKNQQIIVRIIFKVPEKKAFLSPIINNNSINYFMQNKDDLYKASFMWAEDEEFDKFFNLLPDYYLNRKDELNWAFKDIWVLDFSLLIKFKPSFEKYKDYFLYTQQIEDANNPIFVSDKEIKEKILYEKLTNYFENTNDFIDKLVNLEINKYSKANEQKILKIKEENFIKHTVQHVGFGDSGYLEFEDKKIILDFGGTKPVGNLAKYQLDSLKNYVILTHWHIDHFKGYKHLNVSKANTTFIASSMIMNLSNLFSFLEISEKVSKVILINKTDGEIKHPSYIIDDVIFIYGLSGVDNTIDLGVDKNLCNTYFDMNSTSFLLFNQPKTI